MKLLLVWLSQFVELLNKVTQTKGDSVAMLLVYSGIQLRLHLLLGYSACKHRWEDARGVLIPVGTMRAALGTYRDM